MKKIRFITFALALAVLMQAAVYGAAGFTFTVDTLGDVNVGESIAVPISVNGNPGFNSVGLLLTYNPLVLEITGVNSVESAMPLNSQFALTTTPGTQWISLVNPGLLDWGGNGVVANVSFNVLQNAQAGSSRIDLNFTTAPDGTPSNAGGTILRNAAAIAGTVNVVIERPPTTDTDPFDDAPMPATDAETAPTPPDNPLPGITPGTVVTPVPGSVPQVTSVPLFDGSDFTGVPYTPPASDVPTETAAPATAAPATASSATAGPAIASPATANPAATFGPVPQTGVAATNGTLIAALVACLTITASLWVRVIFKKKRHEGNG
jgi:hypothetical protein